MNLTTRGVCRICSVNLTTRGVYRICSVNLTTRGVYGTCSVKEMFYLTTHSYILLTKAVVCVILFVG